MQIGIDISSATPGRTGIGTYTWELTRRLIRSRDHDWVLLFHSLRQPAPDWPEFRASNVRLIHRRIPGPLLLKLWQFGNLPDIEKLAGGPLDLFHSPASYVPPQRHGIRVTTIHDLHFLQPGARRAPLGGQYIDWVIRNRANHCHLILTDAPSVSREVAAMVNRSGPNLWMAEPGKLDNQSSGSGTTRTKTDPTGQTDKGLRKVTPIPLGVDLRFFEPVSEQKLKEVRAQYKLPSSFLLTIGGTEPRKNLARIRQAWRQLERSDLQEIPPLVSLGTTDEWHSNAYPLAHVGHDDLPALYRLATALLFPSLHEGFGLPVLEAMATGCPVLTSAAVAVTEYLPASAVVTCDPTKVESIQSMIYELLTTPERLVTLVEGGPEHASRFTWDETARLTIQAYETAAAKL